MSLKNKNILIGIGSSIAAFKIVELAERLKKEGATVKVMLTENAKKLIDPREFRCEVITELFLKGYNYKKYLEKKKFAHIDLNRWADVIVLAPATANLIGKIANGIADDLITTVVITHKKDVLIAPAMNMDMYENPIVKKNVEALRRVGYCFIPPKYGILACEDVGMGKLADVGAIVKEMEGYFRYRNQLQGKRILVTAGATSEEIDPVRVITNRSSGKMGIAIAEEAAKRGAEVTLIRGLTIIEPAAKLKDIQIQSADEMAEAIKKHIKQDIVIHAAAVSDFSADKKDKKIDSGKSLHLELTPAAKILENVRKWNKKALLVGFKAEYRLSEKELMKKAYETLKKSDADMMVANDVGKEGRGFETDTNEVFLIDRKKKITHFPLDSKQEIARKILDSIHKLL